MLSTACWMASRGPKQPKTSQNASLDMEFDHSPPISSYVRPMLTPFSRLGFVPSPTVAPTSLPSVITGSLAATTSLLAPAAAQAQEAAEATINPRDAIVQAFALTFVSEP